jgi:hypothetical protein
MQTRNACTFILHMYVNVRTRILEAKFTQSWWVSGIAVHPLGMPPRHQQRTVAVATPSRCFETQRTTLHAQHNIQRACRYNSGLAPQVSSQTPQRNAILLLRHAHGHQRLAPVPSITEAIFCSHPMHVSALRPGLLSVSKAASAAINSEFKSGFLAGELEAIRSASVCRIGALTHMQRGEGDTMRILHVKGPWIEE